MERHVVPRLDDNPSVDLTLFRLAGDQSERRSKSLGSGNAFNSARDYAPGL
jgi:hypothetical protein